MVSKRKYKSLDNRTGYEEGSLVELTVEELKTVPFNVKMQLMEPIDDKKEIEERLSEAYRDDLRGLLKDRGLSPQRIKKVLEKAPDKPEGQSAQEILNKLASEGGIDELTDKWLKEEFNDKKKSSKSKKESDK